MADPYRTPDSVPEYRNFEHCVECDTTHIAAESKKIGVPLCYVHWSNLSLGEKINIGLQTKTLNALERIAVALETICERYAQRT